MSDLTINIKFFGVFRQHGEDIDITVPVSSTVADVKKALQDKLGNSLVSESVLANDSSILRDRDIIDSDSCFSILPPVCGG